MTKISDLAEIKGLKWLVTLATDDASKTFTVFAFSRADAIALSKVKWGPGSAWCFVKEAKRA